MRALLVIIALAGVAYADTKLGFRLAFSRTPLEEEPLGAMGIALGLEHRISDRNRAMAEYEFMWLNRVPPEDEMPAEPPQPYAGMGHRVHLGFRREIERKDLHSIRFYADVEIGGGLGMYDAPTGVEVEPHGFLGVRGGYHIRMSDSKSTQFETEIHFRALFLEYGVGFGGGLGFYWGGAPKRSTR